MIQFTLELNTLLVQINGKTFGVINKNGFFLSDMLVTGIVRLSADDLRQIAAKVDDVRAGAAPEHDVCREAGEGGRPKLVCRSPGCNGACLEMKQGMNVEDWAEAREKFLIKHPCERIRKA